MAYENRPNNEYETINLEPKHRLKENGPDTEGHQTHHKQTSKIREEPMDNDQQEQITSQHEYQHLQRGRTNARGTQEDVHEYADLKARNGKGMKHNRQKIHVLPDSIVHQAKDNNAYEHFSGEYPRDVHHYQDIPASNANQSRSPEPLQMASSEERKPARKNCPPPTWLVWLMVFVGLGIACLIVTLAVVFLWSKFFFLILC